MKELFPGYVRPTPDEIVAFWREATFAVDTNVLLNLYRYSEEARKDLLAALQALGDRLWVPHGVVEEYHRNRFGVLLERYTAKDALESLLERERRDLLEALEKHERERTRRAGQDGFELVPIAEKSFDELREQLLEREDATRAQLGGADPLDDDPIYSELCELLDGRIGEPFAQARLDEIHTAGEQRYEAGIPPGYLDADEDGPERYGDLVIWLQLIEHAKATQTPIVFVTGDRKDDWFWRVSGRTIGPRPELVREMRAEGGVDFHAYPTDRFLAMARDHLELGSEVSDEAIDEVRAATPRQRSPEKSSLMRRTWASVLANSTDNPTASSVVSIDGAHLYLEISGEFMDADIVCDVSGPGGSVASHRRMLRADPERGPINSARLSVDYPGDFSDAALRDGPHVVVWTVNKGEPDNRLETAVDTFTIEP